MYNFLFRTIDSFELRFVIFSFFILSLLHPFILSLFKSLIISILTILAIPIMAQEKKGFVPDFRLSQSTLVSSGKDLPFWMVSNQNGIFTFHNPSYLLFYAGLSRSLERDADKNWGYAYGANPTRARLAYGSVARVDF